MPFTHLQFKFELCNIKTTRSNLSLCKEYVSGLFYVSAFTERTGTLLQDSWNLLSSAFGGHLS